MADVWNTPTQSGTTGGEFSIGITFTAGVLSASHVGVVYRVRDGEANLYRYFITTALLSDRSAIGYWTNGSPRVGYYTQLWEESAAGVYGGFRSVAIHQQRLVFGGARDAGNSLWLSKAGQFRNFDLGSAADADGIAVTASGGVRNISHIISAGALIVFTDGGVMASPISETKSVTPTTFRLVNVSEHAAAVEVLPLAFDGGVLFSQSVSGAVRDVAPAENGLTVDVTPLSLAVPDLVGKPVDSAALIAIQQRPEQYAFFVTSTGEMAVLHSIRQQSISSWVRWTTNGFYRSIAAVNGRTFAAVSRAGKLRLELFDPGRAFDASVIGAGPYLSAPHLAGYVCALCTPTTYLGLNTLGDTGAFSSDLGGAASGEGGLAFDWWIDPLPPYVVGPTGPITNRTQRVVSTSLLLHRARSAAVANETLELRADGFDLAEPTYRRSGWWTARHLGWVPRDEAMPASLRITRNVPLPVGVLAMIRKVAA